MTEEPMKPGQQYNLAIPEYLYLALCQTAAGMGITPLELVKQFLRLGFLSIAAEQQGTPLMMGGREVRL